MSEREDELQLEGIVRASRYDPDAPGKQFLGAEIVCGDGMTWVIDYSELSPFHAFADRRVVVSGRPYQPQGQHLAGEKLGHLSVSALRLAEEASDAELVEVGPARQLGGRFERGTDSIGQHALTFVTEGGDTFPVTNDPAGMTVGRAVEVLAYPVQPSPAARRRDGQYLWIICPYSAADLREWRGRYSGF